MMLIYNMSVINEYAFFFDSKYRTGGGNGDPEFMLSDSVFLDNPNNFFTAKLVSCDIPYSFQNLTAPNNVVQVRIQVIPLSVDYITTLTITAGNYSILTLLNELNSKLTTLTATLDQPPVYKFSYDKPTSKCTLNMTVAGGNETYVTIMWNTADILAEYMGFSYAADTIIGYSGTTDLSVDNVSPYNVNVSPISSLYIRSSTLTQQSNNSEFLVEAAQSISDIICKVPISTSSGAWIVYENGVDFKVRLNVKSIDRVSFYLTNGLTYDVLDLFNVHWRCCLMIQEIEPSYVTQMRLIDSDRHKKVNEMQNMKQDLLNELSNISQDLKGQ